MKIVFEDYTKVSLDKDYDVLRIVIKKPEMFGLEKSEPVVLQKHIPPLIEQKLYNSLQQGAHNIEGVVRST